MLRISKLADYAVVLVTHMAHLDSQEQGHENVRNLAAATRIPEPTVRKVLKALSRAGIVSSQRGTNGGYGLARTAAHINVVEILSAIEGPIGITECTSEATAGDCEYEVRCRVRGRWQKINSAIHDALAGINLAELAATPSAGGESGDGEPAQDHSIEDPIVHLRRSRHSDTNLVPMAKSSG